MKRRLPVYKIVETASLPAEKANNFFMPWLVVYNGYIAGISDLHGALHMAAANDD